MSEIRAALSARCSTTPMTSSDARRAGTRHQFGHRSQIRHHRYGHSVDDRVETDLRRLPSDRDAVSRLLLETHEHLGMVATVRADARQVDDHVDTVTGATRRLGRCPTSGEGAATSPLRRTARSRRPFCVSSEPRRSISTPTARLPCISRRRAVALLSIVRLGRCRFGTMYAVGRVDAHAVEHVARQGPAPRSTRRVLVDFVGEAERRARRRECVAQRMKSGRGDPRDRHRTTACRGTRCSGKSRSSSSRREEWQHLGERPFVVAERCPLVEVIGGGSNEHPSVHRARPTHHLAARHRRPLSIRSGWL